MNWASEHQMMVGDMRSRMRLQAVISGFLIALAAGAQAQNAEVIIETRIKPPDVQAGMKSTQTIKLDYAGKKATQTFTTGVTNIGIAELGSIRDKFTVDQIRFSGKVSEFTATGQTASAIFFMPNINYKFSITVDMTVREIVFHGCHDGYPSYKISVQGKEVYAFAQENLGALFGSCDTKVTSTKKKF